MLKCKYHPVVEVTYREDKYRCKILPDQKIYYFCGNIEDMFNYKAAKVRVKKITKKFRKRLVPLERYLRYELLPGNCSFYFKDDKVCCSN